MFLQHLIMRDDGFVPLGTELGRALEGLVVDVVEAEALGVSVVPLEVVEQAPTEVALDGVALGDGAMKLGEVIAQVHDAVGVVDVAVGRKDIR